MKVEQSFAKYKIHFKNFVYSSRVADAVAQPFPEFNLDDFKSSCLNSGKAGQAATAKKASEVLMPSSMSMPAIATPKPAPQLKCVKFVYFMK